MKMERNENNNYRTYEKLNNIYGANLSIAPFRMGNKRGLENILPLEKYDKILVGFSGGKDSVAACLYLLEMGVPKNKITLMHHCIDGSEDANDKPLLKMDWRCTKDYCNKFAEAIGLNIKYSWREEGFLGEILRLGASKPISFESLSNGNLISISTENWRKTTELKRQLKEAEEIGDIEQIEDMMCRLKQLGYRYKFPAKTASLSTRWCSSALKIEVFDRIIRYADETNEDCKILFVDGIRREESTARNKYNEMEIHRCSATAKKGRLVHHWRPIIEWTEQDVWDIFKRYNINPHPCYRLGWNRCSCAMCIFSLPKHFKGIKELMPDEFNKLVQLEKNLGFTLDNKKNLETYIENSDSCVLSKDKDLQKLIKSKVLPDNYIIVKDWVLPSGAYHGSEGGPC